MKIKTPEKTTKAILDIVDRSHTLAKEKVGESKRFDYLRNTFIKLLKKEGFRDFDNGGFKQLFQHDSYPEILVKVYYRSKDHTIDTCMPKLPSFLRKHFVIPIKTNHLYILQPLVNCKRGRWRSSAAKALYKLLKDPHLIDLAGDLDITCDNVLFHDGKPAIIDFCRV